MRSDLQERGGKTALVVIDVQNAVVADAWDAAGVVSRIATVIGAARQSGTPVVYIQHDTPGEEELAIGSDAWRFHPDVTPGDGEPVVAKQHGDAFVETALEETLADLGAGHLILVGRNRTPASARHRTARCGRATTSRSSTTRTPRPIVRTGTASSRRS